MTGWLAAALIAGVAMLLLWRVFRLPRVAWEATAAALLLGLTGYALTGNPSSPGAPARGGTRGLVAVDERSIELRDQMGEGFGRSRNWLVASDGAARLGLPAASVNYLRSGLREEPGSADLWLGLGNALVAQAEGTVTPAARLAFARAAQLRPDNPAPWFFLGLSLLRAGEADEARRMWRQALIRTPADAEYRPVIEAAVAISEGRAPQPGAAEPPSPSVSER